MIAAIALVLVTAVLVGGILYLVNRFNSLFNDDTMKKLDDWSTWMRESAGYADTK